MMNKNQTYYSKAKTFDKKNHRDRMKPQDINLNPIAIPDDYIEEAEKIMRRIYNKITSSKIRSFLSFVSKVYNVENTRTEATLLQESMDTLEHMRIRVIYEAGREDSIRMIEFIRDSRIINYIKSIGNSRKEFIKFARYMEALVAYHKFYGGRD